MKMTDIEFAFEWIEKAEHDLFIMRLGLDNADTPADVLCFHAQQVMEKAVKALLTAHSVRFAKTHDLIELLESAATLLPNLERFREPMSKATAYAADVRYPGEQEELSREDVTAVAQTAGQVFRMVKGHFESINKSNKEVQ